MIRDLLIGLGLIVYAFSGMWCYLLLSAALIDGRIQCQPEAPYDLSLSLSDRIIICLFSMIPILNTVMSIRIDKHYEEFIETAVKNVKERRGKYAAENRDVTEQTESSTTDSN